MREGSQRSRLAITTTTSCVSAFIVGEFAFRLYLRSSVFICGCIRGALQCERCHPEHIRPGCAKDLSAAALQSRQPQAAFLPSFLSEGLRFRFYLRSSVFICGCIAFRPSPARPSLPLRAPPPELLPHYPYLPKSPNTRSTRSGRTPRPVRPARTSARASSLRRCRP